MKTFLRSNITALLVLLLYHAESQEGVLNFEHITGVKGVALGKITCITQDKFGYMWFADQSNQSIVRFDGYRMKVFRHVVGDSNSITLGGVEAIATDIKGNVWIGNQNGVDKLIPSENKVKHYYFPTGKRSGYVLTILVDHLGTVWIGTGDGLYSFEEKTGKFSHYTNKPDDTTSLSCNLVYTVYEDHQGVLWIGTGWPYGKYILDVPGGGLNRFNRQTRTFTQYKHNPNDPKSLINDKVRAIFEDSRGNFWVGTQGDGLHIMNRQSGTFERFVYDRAHPEKLSRPPSNGTFDHIPFITEDGAGEIWIGTYLQGLVKYDPVTKKVTHFKFDIKTNGFSDSTSWCAFKSRDGALWISTEQKNLFRVDPLAGKFSYTHLNAYSWNFLEDPPKILWVGKYNSGLSKVDRRIPGKMAIYNYFVNAENSIGVNAMCRADSGIYWVATFSGLYQFDVKRQRFLESSITDKKRGKALKAIALFNDHANNELYITGIGLHVLNTKTNTLTEYWHDTKDTTSISADTLVFNVPDRTGNIWIGTKSQGINYFDRSKRTFTRFLPDLTTFCAYIDSHQTVWAGTDLGIYRKEEKSDSFSLFVPAATDMTFTPITALTGDDQGNIWAAASPGIFRINTESDEYCIYGRKFGITGINMLTKTDAMRTSDGKILIGAEDGYYSFDPKEVVNSVKPNILLTGFKIDGRSLTLDSNGILNRPIEEMRQIKLGHKQNIFSIDFAAIHFSDPEGNVHRYMLEGYENTWREAGAEKTAYYFNIPPGNYMFHIKAVSSYGATATKSIEIIIFPPWWRTWWAYCLYGVIAIVTVWAFIRWRTAQLKKENILLEEKVVQRTKELVATQSQLIAEKEAKLFADFNRKFSESELKALRAQMNPHFVFNILNTIESYALDNNKEAASLMIQKFSRLTRMVLENSMNQLVPIKNDLKALQLYIELEQMRYADKFLVKYNIDANMLDEDYMIPPMIIQPFVENAILHGLRNRPNNNGILNVSATVQDGYIIISVEDNGVGRAKSATLKINNPIQKKSLGINVTQDRISIFNNLNQSRKAKVEIQDLKEGTRVIIQLPIHA